MLFDSCLRAARGRHAELFTSTPSFADLTDIICRRKFEKKIAASLLIADHTVDRYAAMAGAGTASGDAAHRS